MAIIGTSVPTVLDIAAAMGPDGSFDTERVNLLVQTNEMLSDMVWQEGNLPDGHKTNIVTGLPSVGFRRINEGVALSKSTGAAITEGAASLEGFFQVDRALALMSGDVNKYRYSESRLFLESMNQTQQTYTLYGNAAVLPESYTGLSARYGTLAGGQVYDAGGTGTDNTSIWLVGWGPDTVFGIYPKGTVGGLQHEDVTVNRAAMPGTSINGAMVGDVLQDANGRNYMGYRDHFFWNCGLAVKNRLAVARAANIDVSDLREGAVGAADIVSLMVKLTYLIPSHMRKNRGNAGLFRPAFYVNSTIKAALHEQAINKVGTGGGLQFSNVGGEEVLNILGIPIREVDQLLTTEARVV
jgi:hypothetical protein